MINLKQQYGKVYKINFDEAYDPKGKHQHTLDPHYMQVTGKFGVIYPHSNSQLGVEVDHHPTASNKLKTLGYQLHQDGDHEFTFLFNPEQFEEVAIIIRARKRRVLTPEQRCKLSKVGFKREEINLLG